MSPIVVEATRGDVVEARHVVHAVAVRDGGIELAAGDSGLVTFLRSSAKPLQALPVVRARPDLDEEQVAPLRLGAFRAIRPALAHVLERLGLDPGDLGDVDVRNSRDERVGDLRVVAS